MNIESAVSELTTEMKTNISKMSRDSLERAVLAAIMMEGYTGFPDGLQEIVQRFKINPSHFSSEKNREIFVAMYYSGPERQDLVRFLEENNTLDSVGGLEYLESLDADLPDVCGVDHLMQELQLRVNEREDQG